MRIGRHCGTGLEPACGRRLIRKSLWARCGAEMEAVFPQILIAQRCDFGSADFVDDKALERGHGELAPAVR